MEPNSSDDLCLLFCLNLILQYLALGNRPPVPAATLTDSNTIEAGGGGDSGEGQGGGY